MKWFLRMQASRSFDADTQRPCAASGGQEHSANDPVTVGAGHLQGGPRADCMESSMRIFVIAVLLATVSVATLAQCDEGGALQINECLAKAARVEDQKLNRAYGHLMKALPRDRQRALQAVERAWLNFAEKHCEFESSAFAGGSLEALTYQTCIADLARERTRQLTESPQCESGPC